MVLCGRFTVPLLERAPGGEASGRVDDGRDVLLSPTATLGIAYTGHYGDGVTENGLNARLSVRF